MAENPVAHDFFDNWQLCFHALCQRDSGMIYEPKFCIRKIFPKGRPILREKIDGAVPSIFNRGRHRRLIEISLPNQGMESSSRNKSHCKIRDENKIF
jgi:hypothetical protein